MGDRKKPSTFIRPSSASQGAGSGDVPEAVIRKLSDILKSTDLAEIEVTMDKIKVRVRAKELAQAPIIVPTAAHSVPATATASGGLSKKTSEASQTDLHIVRSPFVGTFYRAPSPTSPAFVEVGQTVTKGQALCIIEAMKLMNEIEADMTGVIEKIFVENGSPVDFNAPLFGLRKP